MIENVKICLSNIRRCKVVKELLMKILDDNENDSLKEDFNRFISQRLTYHDEKLSMEISKVTEELLKSLPDDEMIFRLFVKLEGLLNQRSTEIVDSAYLQGFRDGIRLRWH
jgi:adenosyl cobinamide kinase/adenosyl cobinamide phosphate guanylyltransferase